MPEFVRLVNRRDRAFDFMANSRQRVIAPGGDAIVPWGIATSLFGDPRVVNRDARNERNNLYNKVRARFNYCLGMMTEEEWEEIAPKIDVYDLETDEQVFLVYHDPEGTRAMEMAGTANGDEQTEIAILKRQMAAMNARMEALLSQSTGEAPTPAASSTQALVTPSTDTAIISDAAVGQVEQPAPIDGGSVTVDVPPAAPSVDVPQQVPVGEGIADSEPAPTSRRVAAKTHAK